LARQAAEISRLSSAQEITSICADFLVVDAVLQNRSPKGFFLSNREFIAQRGEEQGLSIAIGLLKLQIGLRFQSDSTRICRFPVTSENRRGFIHFRHILAPYQA
jgi:hypothetical protein